MSKEPRRKQRGTLTDFRRSRAEYTAAMAQFDALQAKVNACIAQHGGLATLDDIIENVDEEAWLIRTYLRHWGNIPSEGADVQDRRVRAHSRIVELIIKKEV